MVKIKSFFKVILSIFIVAIIIIGGGVVYLKNGLETGNELIINNVNIASLSDGSYNGKYDGGRWSNEVSIAIKNHKITKIDVIKDVVFKKPEVTEEILNKVIKNQNINVDVVSGATVTSKAYLKSIENALKK